MSKNLPQILAIMPAAPRIRHINSTQSPTTQHLHSLNHVSAWGSLGASIGGDRDGCVMLWFREISAVQRLNQPLWTCRPQSLKACLTGDSKPLDTKKDIKASWVSSPQRTNEFHFRCLWNYRQGACWGLRPNWSANRLQTLCRGNTEWKPASSPSPWSWDSGRKRSPPLWPSASCLLLLAPWSSLSCRRSQLSPDSPDPIHSSCPGISAMST